MTGAKIKRFREEAGLTQAQLAEQSEVTQTQISQIETGNGFIAGCKFKTVKRISMALNVSLDEIAFIDGKKNSKIRDRFVVANFNKLDEDGKQEVERFIKYRVSQVLA